MSPSFFARRGWSGVGSALVQPLKVVIRLDPPRGFALGLGVFVGYLGVFDGWHAWGLGLSFCSRTLYVAAARSHTLAVKG